MSSHLLHAGIPLTEKVLRTVAVYAAIAVLLRLAGKRDLAQLNTFDLVVVLLLSNVVQNAVIGPDDSLVGGLVGAVVLVGVNAVVVRVVNRNDRLATVFEGTPTVLVDDGVLLHDALRREGLRAADVTASILHQGASNLDEVQRATLEPGGAIVVALKPGARNATVADLERLERKLDALLAGA
jgi:uncharacterized membrane protein YcaP (DUF421 family)